MTFNRNKEFKKDIKWGKWGEGVMIPFLEEVFKFKDKYISYWYSSDDLTKNVKDLKKWDLRYGVYEIGDRINWIKKIEFEVKTDGYGFDTGNLVFEKSSGRKKSGVFASEATYFVYFLPLFDTNNVYIIQSEKLIKLLEEFGDNYVVSGGDYGSNTFMYKISKLEFNDKFIEAGGKILTCFNYKIPDEFNKQKFNKNTIIYSGGGDQKNYEDPFYFP
jgi:hypothetical protein